MRSVLTRALGDDKAGYLLDRILQGGDPTGIESLKWMDAAERRRAHPQRASADHRVDPRAPRSRPGVGGRSREFTERLRNDVLLRIATLDGIQPAAMRELNEVLSKLLSHGRHREEDVARRHRAPRPRSSISWAARRRPRSSRPCASTTRSSPQKILDEMFVFENLLDVDDRGIQALLREVQSESLIVALKGATQELRDKIFKNMSQRAAEMLKDDLEAKGPVRVSEVETEQKEILKIVRRMADEGQMVIGGKGDDGFV